MIEYTGPIIVIAGPTASGKSSIAIKLAKEIGGVIINADSKQVYKEISIGTAKPTEDDMQGIPHHLYGHVSVKDGYNIFKYQTDVNDVLKNLSNNQIPILVGGTGLYIDSVIFNYNLKENDIDLEKREELNSLSVDELKKLLETEVLDELNESDRENPIRLIRLIEKSSSKELIKGRTLNHIYFVVDKEKVVLSERIKTRVQDMFNNGLLEENIQIRENGLEKYLALKTIGYQEFDEYFEGKKSLDEIKEEIINHTNQYAKRQRTWFRKHKEAIWTDDYDLVLEKSEKFINT
jgi:tRNA dimethylallyltransferase